MSICSFLRKELNIHGKTTHNGRGGYEMTIDLYWEEIKAKINEKVPEWEEKGWITGKHIDDDQITITFHPSVNAGEEYYRTLFVNEFLVQRYNMMKVNC